MQARPAELAELAKTLNATRSPEAQRHYLKGLEHVRLGEMLQLKEAIKSFRKALIEDENYALAYAGLAEAYARQVQGEQNLLVTVPVDGFMAQQDPLELARQNLRQAQKLAPELPQVLRAQAWVEYIAGDADRAMDTVREAIRRAPRDSDSVILYLSLRFLTGRLAKSLDSMRQELQQMGADLEDPWTQFTLAAFAFGLEATKPNARLDWIEQMLDNVGQKLPDLAYVPLLQYSVAMFQGQTEKAQRFFAQAYEKGRQSPDVLTSLALLRVSEQRYQEALTLVDQAEKIMPESMMVRLARADVLNGLGQTQQAEALYAVLERDYPDNAMIPFSRGSRLLATDAVKARELLAASLRNWDKEPSGLPRSLVVYLLAIAEMVNQNWDAARQHFELLRSDPTYYGQAYEQLARIHHMQQDPAAALEAYQAYLSIYPDRATDPRTHQQYRLYYLLNQREKEPDNAAVLNDLGQIAQLKEEWDQAAEYWLLALKLNPQEAVIHYNLGSLYLQQQQWPAASQHLQEAVRLRPDYVRAWFNLGLVYQAQNQLDAARAAWQRVLELQPDHPEAARLLKTL
ncbi:MAG: tetratricopeptide repeat protein [Candidatus Sericytochromatia bacterium]|nr:tetratricopeptide repeat protein [Candidatus Sericytochromatia bacterium]